MVVAQPLNLSARMKPAAATAGERANATERTQPQGQPFMAARPLIRAVCAKVLRLPLHDSEVEDCVAETLKRAVEGQARLQPGAALGPWLTGIAKHVAIDRGRSRRRERARAVDSDADEVLADLGDETVNPEQAASQRQTVARLQTAMSQLAEGPKRALLAFHLEGKSYAEIAQELGVSLGTVATWVSRGRSEIAKTMESEREVNHG
jgi:RNA polymerase sigma factor (sigma-70 family)